MKQDLFSPSNGSATWNGSDARLLAYRECIRVHGPGKREGLGVYDLDLYLSIWKAWDERSKLKKLLLAEVKSCDDKCDHSTRRDPKPMSRFQMPHMFGQQCMAADFDHALRRSYPIRYVGFYLISMEHEDPHKSEWIYANGTLITLDEWHRLSIYLETDVPPLVLPVPSDFVG